MVNLEKLGSFGEGRKRKRLEEYVRLVNSFEPELEEVMTADLPAKTEELRRRLEGALVLPRRTLRASASAPDLESGLDLLVERLERQVRDYREKRKKRLLPTANRLKSTRIGPDGRRTGA